MHGWKKQENSLRQLAKKRDTLPPEGGGRKIKLEAVEKGVMGFYGQCRERKVHVS